MTTDQTALQTVDAGVQTQSDVVAVIQKQLTTAQIEQAVQIGQKELNPADPNSISTFGSAVETQLSRSVDPLLEKVRVKDSGAVVGMLNGLLDTTRSFNPRALTTDRKRLLG